MRRGSVSNGKGLQDPNEETWLMRRQLGMKRPSTRRSIVHGSSAARRL